MKPAFAEGSGLFYATGDNAGWQGLFLWTEQLPGPDGSWTKLNGERP